MEGSAGAAEPRPKAAVRRWKAVPQAAWPATTAAAEKPARALTRHTTIATQAVFIRSRGGLQRQGGGDTAEPASAHASRARFSLPCVFWLLSSPFCRLSSPCYISSLFPRLFPHLSRISLSSRARTCAAAPPGPQQGAAWVCGGGVHQGREHTLPFLALLLPFCHRLMPLLAVLQKSLPPLTASPPPPPPR